MQVDGSGDTWSGMSEARSRDLSVGPVMVQLPLSLGIQILHPGQLV